MNKISEQSFELFRYQMNPVNNLQLKLFGEQITPGKLKEIKNAVFADEILEIDQQYLTGKGLYIQKLLFRSDSVFIYKLASKKKITHHTEDLVDEIIDDYPFIYLLINNDPQSQVIGIGRNYKAFDGSNTVANILEKNYSAALKRNDLTFSVTPILDELEYWKVISSYENRITQIRFDIIKPNITNISKSLKEGVKSLSDSTNSLRTRIELNAPEDQVLEGINSENDQIKALSDYSVNGGGDVSLRVKGIKKRVKTSKSVRSFEADSLHLEGQPDVVAELFKKISS